MSEYQGDFVLSFRNQRLLVRDKYRVLVLLVPLIDQRPFVAMAKVLCSGLIPSQRLKIIF